MPDRQADHPRLGVHEFGVQAGEVGGQPDEGDVHPAVAQRRHLLAPVEPLGRHPYTRVAAGELGPRPGGELAGAAGLEAHAQHPGLATPVPFRGGRHPAGLAQRAAGLGHHVAPCRRLGDAPGVPVGLMFIPMTAFTTLVNLLAGKLTNRYGPRLPLILGQVIQTVGILGLLLVRRDTPTALLLTLLVPLGIGGGLAIPPLTSAMLESVPHERAGLASGVLSAARQFGGAMGVALLGALIADSAHFMTGMRISLIVGAAVLVATTLGVALFLPGGPSHGSLDTRAGNREACHGLLAPWWLGAAMTGG